MDIEVIGRPLFETLPMSQGGELLSKGVHKASIAVSQMSVGPVVLETPYGSA